MRDKLQFATQEIQTLVSRHAELPKQFAAFIEEVMKANGLNSLVVAIDGLDELRDPAKPSDAVLTDFLPCAEDLPRGCVVAMTTRPAVCPRVRGRLNALAVTPTRIAPGAEPNRELIRRYLQGHDAEVLRSPAAVERVLELSGGVFLYAVHFARALAAGAYSGVEDLPEAGRFYADYLARLRERVGPELYESVHEKALMFLVAAQVPVTRAQLHRWGVPADRMAFALRDVGDFVRELRHRGWHDEISDDTDPRYEIAHEAFARFASTDVATDEKLKAAHNAIARVALRHSEKRWENIDPLDNQDLYDLRFILHHGDAAGKVADVEALRADDVLARAIWGAANQASELARYRLAMELYEQCEALYGELAMHRGRGEMATSLASALVGQGNSLERLGQLTEAVELYDRAIAVCQDVHNCTEVANALSGKCVALTRLGRQVESLACADDAIRIFRNNEEFTDNLANTLVNKGITLQELGRLAEALECYDNAITTFRRLLDNHRAGVSHHLANALMNKGTPLQGLGRFVEAVECYDEAIAIMRDLVDGQRRSELTDDLANPLMNKGVALRKLGRPGEAIVSFDEAIGLYHSMVVSRTRLELAPHLAMALMNKGLSLNDLGDWKEAIEHYDEAIELYRYLIEDHRREEWIPSLARTLFNQGLAFEAGGRVAEAIRQYDEALAIFRHLFQRSRFELLPNLLQAYTRRWCHAVTHGSWDIAASITLHSVVAFTAKERAREITSGDQQQMYDFCGRLRQLTSDQRDLLLASAGEGASVLREVFGRVDRW